MSGERFCPLRLTVVKDQRVSRTSPCCEDLEELEVLDGWLPEIQHPVSLTCHFLLAVAKNGANVETRCYWCILNDSRGQQETLVFTDISPPISQTPSDRQIQVFVWNKVAKAWESWYLFIFCLTVRTAAGCFSCWPPPSRAAALTLAPLNELEPTQPAALPTAEAAHE